jgi:GntP family gluconate:H+ symporter
MLSSTGWVGEAMLAAAVIILITGAGGAFGKVLQQSGMVDLIGPALLGGSIGLWLPFLISAALRAAQGSATVAIITTASLLAPLAASLGLASPVGKALMVLAIGAGAMVASHANDSMFWIVTQMSGMSVGTGFRLITLLTIALGFTAALLIWLVGLVML